MRPSIVFDLDGTLALGQGPVEAYARALGELTADDSFLPEAQRRLVEFNQGTRMARDGYGVVRALAGEREIPSSVVAVAYRSSRALLGTDAAPVLAPDGFRQFAVATAPSASLILATNATSAGVVELLERWGVRELFEDLNFEVGKPDGLGPIIEQLLTRGPVLAVGDIAENDLIPARDLGAETALVGPAAETSTEAVTFRAPLLSDLYSDISTWVARALAQEGAAGA